MFEKFAQVQDSKERVEIYNLLKFNLAFCLRLVEFVSLALLLAGLGWRLSRLTEPLGTWPGALTALALMMLFIGLARLPFKYAGSAVDAAFGLDPRPAGRRLKRIVGLTVRRGFLLWLVSVPLYVGLVKLDLWVWTLAALGLGAVLTALAAYGPGLWSPEKIRPPAEGELPADLVRKLGQWEKNTGLAPGELAISTTFSPHLAWPRLEGLGRARRLVISEKALSSFTPRELSILTVLAVVEVLIKAPLKFLLLRFCALAVAVPLGAIFISTLGLILSNYPIKTDPSLMVMVWLAGWLGQAAAELAARLTRRALEPQMAAAAALILKDETALDTALAVTAAKNLEEEQPSLWRALFQKRLSRPAFLKQVEYHRHLASFQEKK